MVTSQGHRPTIGYKGGGLYQAYCTCSWVGVNRSVEQDAVSDALAHGRATNGTGQEMETEMERTVLVGVFAEFRDFDTDKRLMVDLSSVILIEDTEVTEFGRKRACTRLSLRNGQWVKLVEPYEKVMDVMLNRARQAGGWPSGG